MKIKIKKGANINLVGVAKKETLKHEGIQEVAIRTTDFLGLTPKLAVKEGAEVVAGNPIFYDKERPEIQFVAPISGFVEEIQRGEKRKVLAVKIKVSTEKKSEKTFAIGDLNQLEVDKIKEIMLEAGLWPFITQRPYAIVADPTSSPKAIFISAMDTSPLAPDYNYLLDNNLEALQTAVDILSKFSKKIYFNISEKEASQGLKSVKNAIVNTVSGAHPAGNIGVQINHIEPVNKGEVVWTINALDLVTIGKFFKTGVLDFTRTVAVTGSNLDAPKYYSTILGAKLSNIFSQSKEHSRYISGNPLTGVNVGKDGYLGFYHHQLSVIPECIEADFLGWNKPQFNKFSFSRSNVSWLFPNKKYKLTTSMNGEERAFVVTGEYEKFFPMDIHPVFLIKAMITKDLDMMEKLGVYEVAPEDFALCEFACTSKIPLQKIVSEALMLVKKECS